MFSQSLSPPGSTRLSMLKRRKQQRTLVRPRLDCRAESGNEDGANLSASEEVKSADAGPQPRPPTLTT